MRHGPAEDRAASGRDLDRPLSKSGRLVVMDVATRLRAARATPMPRILSSPALRAIETATIVRDSCADARLEVEIDDDLAPDEDPPLLLVSALLDSGVDAMIVGHQPWVEHLVRGLADDSSSLRGVRTATIVTLESMGRSWRVRSILEGGS